MVFVNPYIVVHNFSYYEFYAKVEYFKIILENAYGFASERKFDKRETVRGMKNIQLKKFHLNIQYKMMKNGSQN